ncbi:MAG: hypothetical protein HC789_15480 [Microcoleus sp. CSU_2_2]|nr:hypothetical protein [Microcoleus sp. SU_5_3]NJS11668.1 hypothetical protein [Microcoleus sp. CSU_2_2]
MIINQLLSIASFKAGDLMQLLGIRGAAIGFGFRDILQKWRAAIKSLLLIQGDYFAQQYSRAS